MGQEPWRLQERGKAEVWDWEGTARHGSGMGQESGKVQEPGRGHERGRVQEPRRGELDWGLRGA